MFKRFKKEDSYYYAKEKRYFFNVNIIFNLKAYTNT